MIATFNFPQFRTSPPLRVINQRAAFRPRKRRTPVCTCRTNVSFVMLLQITVHAGMEMPNKSFICYATANHGARQYGHACQIICQRAVFLLRTRWTPVWTCRTKCFICCITSNRTWAWTLLYSPILIQSCHVCFRIIKKTRAQTAERRFYPVRDSILSFINSLHQKFLIKLRFWHRRVLQQRLCAVADEIGMHKSLQQGE